MRMLLSTIGARGDVQPLVALASHLKTLGPEIRMCVPPDFREWIQSFDIAVVPSRHRWPRQFAGTASTLRRTICSRPSRART
jgi:vancomycin aglycone glucosyltransferase